MGRVLGKVMDWLLVGLMNMVPLFSMGELGFMGCFLGLWFMDRGLVGFLDRELIGFMNRELVWFMDMLQGYFMACFIDWLMLELSILLSFKDGFKV